MATKEVKQEQAAQPNEMESTHEGPIFRPKVDIIEKGNHLLLVAEIPGADPKSIQVDYEDEILTLHAKVNPRVPEGAEVLLQEYEVGDFYRRFQVGKQIDREGISARYENGLLNIHLPISKPQSHTIEVKTG